MNKRFSLILIAITTILALNAVSHSSVHTNQFAFQEKTQALNKLQSTCVFNGIDFINETEDDFNESKFQSHINNSCVVNYIQYKVLTQTNQLATNTLFVCNTPLYQGLPIYIAVGNHRV